MVCPYCKVANPPPVQSDAAAYCISCGREIRLPGPEYSLAEYTPDKDVCPSCGKTGIAVSSIDHRPDSAFGYRLVAPTKPDDLHEDELSPTARLAQRHTDFDPGSDHGGMVERVLGSEVGAIQAILGTSPMGASAGQVAATRHQMTWELWQSAYYCDVDKIVFARRLHSIRTWSPQDFAEEIRTEIPPGAS